MAASRPTYNWTGASGQQYHYYISALPAQLDPDQDGNYIYAWKNQEGEWVPIYIGEGNLAERASDSHHQARCIKQKGATHFHCGLNPPLAARQAEEQDLLARYQNAYQPNGCNERPGG